MAPQCATVPEEIDRTVIEEKKNSDNDAIYDDYKIYEKKNKTYT